MNNRRVLIILLCFLFFGEAIGQNLDAFHDQRSASSELSGTSFSTTNLSTGSLGLVLKLASIGGDIHNLDVSLGREAGSLPVRQAAGEGGVGWQLSVNLSVNVLIRDLPDSDKYGWDKAAASGVSTWNQPLLDALSAPGVAWQDGAQSSSLWNEAWNQCDFMFNVISQDEVEPAKKDGMPDIYVVRIGPGSTRFIFMPGAIVATPLDPTNLELHKDGEALVVQDDAGRNYTFGEHSDIMVKSGIKKYLYFSDFRAGNSNSGTYSLADIPTFKPEDKYKIASRQYYPTLVSSSYFGDRIIFTYETDTWEYTTFSENGYLLTDDHCPGINGMWYEFGSVGSEQFHLHKVISSIKTERKIIKRVENSVLKVDFTWRNFRLTGYPALSVCDPSNYISTVTTTNKIDNVARSTRLVYNSTSVKASSSGVQRLLLTAVNQDDSFGNPEMVYLIDYFLDQDNEGFDVSNRDFDYMGYYNARNNQGYLPYEGLNEEISSLTSANWLFLPGDSRYPHLPVVRRDPNHDRGTGSLANMPSKVFAVKSLRLKSGLVYKYEYEPHTATVNGVLRAVPGCRLKSVNMENTDNPGFVRKIETFSYDSLEVGVAGHTSWGVIYNAPHFTYISYDGDIGTNGNNCDQFQNVNGGAAHLWRTFFISSTSWTNCKDFLGRHIIYSKVHSYSEDTRNTTYFSVFKKKATNTLYAFNVQSNGSLSYFWEDNKRLQDLTDSSACYGLVLKTETYRTDGLISKVQESVNEYQDYGVPIVVNTRNVYEMNFVRHSFVRSNEYDVTRDIPSSSLLNPIRRIQVNFSPLMIRYSLLKRTKSFVYEGGSPIEVSSSDREYYDNSPLMLSRIITHTMDKEQYEYYKYYFQFRLSITDGQLPSAPAPMYTPCYHETGYIVGGTAYPTGSECYIYSHENAKSIWFNNPGEYTTGLYTRYFLARTYTLAEHGTVSTSPTRGGSWQIVPPSNMRLSLSSPNSFESKNSFTGVTTQNTTIFRGVLPSASYSGLNAGFFFATSFEGLCYVPNTDESGFKIKCASIRGSLGRRYALFDNSENPYFEMATSKPLLRTDRVRLVLQARNALNTGTSALNVEVRAVNAAATVSQVLTLPVKQVTGTWETLYFDVPMNAFSSIQSREIDKLVFTFKAGQGNQLCLDNILAAPVNSLLRLTVSDPTLGTLETWGLNGRESKIGYDWHRQPWLRYDAQDNITVISTQRTK